MNMTMYIHLFTNIVTDVFSIVLLEYKCFQNKLLRNQTETQPLRAGAIIST